MRRRGLAVGEPLAIVMGHDGTGRSLKIRGPEPVAEVERIRGNMLRGRLPSWERVVVMTVQDGSMRAFVLVPGPDENEIGLGPFFVRGRFAVESAAYTGKKAQELWKGTEVG